MLRYNEINIGDIFASPLKESKITYEVVRKVGWFIELRPSIKHPQLPATICKNVADAIFNKRIYNTALQPTANSGRS